MQVLGRVRDAGELLEETSAGEKWADGVDADLVGAVLSGEGFGSLFGRGSLVNWFWLGRAHGGEVGAAPLTFDTAALLALYHVNPGRGLSLPMLLMLMMLPPFFCPRICGITAGTL